MAIKTGGLRFALEEEAVVDNEIELGTDETADLPTAEIAADVDEIGDMQNEVDNAADGAGEIEEVKEVFDQSIEEGTGVDENTAKVAEITVEHILDKIGLEKKSFVAIESFGATASRLKSTQIAVEKFSDSIKRIWDTIIKALIVIGEKIRDFFMKFFSNAEKVKAAAKAMKESLAKAQGTPAKDKLELGGVARGFYDARAKKVDIAAVFANQSKLTQTYLGVTDDITSMVSAMEAYLKNPSGNDGLLDRVKGIFSKLSSGLSFKKDTADKDGQKVDSAVAGPFVGGRAFVMELIEANGKTVGFNANFTSGSTEGAPSELAPLSTGEAGKLLDDVIALMDVTEEYKKRQSKIEAINKAMVDTAKSAINLVDKIVDSSEENKNVKAFVESLKKTLMSIGQSNGRLTTLLPSLNVQAGNLVLKYVKASLDNLKSEEAKKEEAPAK